MALTLFSRNLVPAAGAALAMALTLAAVAPAQAEQTTQTITMTDGKLAPQRIEVAAGKETTLTVVNAGKTAAEFESKRLHIEKILAPGKSATIKLRALPKGEYPFVDEFHENMKSARGVIVAK